MKAPADAPERYVYIDVLRGLAALSVVYQHTSEVSLAGMEQSVHPVEKFIIEFLGRQIGIGEIGVCVFLMISGFVVPFSLFRYRSHPIRNFVAHRFFRLYPAYWLSVPLGLVFVSWRFGVAHGGQAIDWPMFFVNLSMFQAFFNVNDLMGQYWTLGLELLFYIACVILFATGRLTSMKAILMAFACVVLLKEAARHIPNLPLHTLWVLSYFRYVGYMFFGLLYRRWLLEGDKKSGRHAALLFALTFLVLGASDMRHALAGDAGALRTQLAQLIAVAIFVACTRLYRPHNAIGKFLGEISYSVYLFHPVVFYPLYLYWFRGSPLNSSPHVFVAVSVILVIAFSFLTYRVIEKPSIELGKKYFSGNDGRLPARAAA
jgi:peptidoglycan/LPS O-acetylase OafA/YrhL